MTRRVTAADEWTAEAYMETDYSTVDQRRFEETVKRFAVFSMLYGDRAQPAATESEDIEHTDDEEVL